MSLQIIRSSFMDEDGRIYWRRGCGGASDRDMYEAVALLTLDRPNSLGYTKVNHRFGPLPAPAITPNDIEKMRAGLTKLFMREWGELPSNLDATIESYVRIAIPTDPSAGAPRAEQERK